MTWSKEIIVVDSKKDEYPYFIATVKKNRLVIAYSIYNQVERQHRNLYLLEADHKLQKWSAHTKNISLPIQNSVPVLITPDSVDLNVFDILIERTPRILFTTFEPFYSMNRFQNSKLFVYSKDKVQLIGENSTVLYSSGGIFDSGLIYSIHDSNINVYNKNAKLKQTYKVEGMLRELRTTGKYVYVISTDSLYINSQGQKWNSELLMWNK